MSERQFAAVDVNSWIGPYPFREIPHPDPEILVRVLDREEIGAAWVGHLPAAFHRDPTPSNRALVRALAPFRNRLHPAPTVRPDWPGWEAELRHAVDSGAPAIRAYPPQWGFGPGNSALNELALACGELNVALLLNVRFEDLRQRHHLDTAGDLSAAAVRAVARLANSRCKIFVLGAGKELIEEIHWGLTESEQQRVWYDFAWVWGPPENHFEQLVRTIGAPRFVVGTGWPMRLTQQSRSLVDLLSDQARESLEKTPFANAEKAIRINQSELK